MVQPQNRSMSISLYIAALAVSDTAALVTSESKSLTFLEKVILKSRRTAENLLVSIYH